VDAEAGKNSMFGRNIIHGYLGGSVFTKVFGTLLYADGNVYMKQVMQFMRRCLSTLNMKPSSP
jgi:acyl dehydratase